MNRTSQQQPIIFSLLDTPAFGGAEQYLLAHLFYLSNHGYSVTLATNCAAVKERVTKQNQLLRGQKQLGISCINAPYRLDAIGNWKGLLKYFAALPWSIFWLIKTVSIHKQDGQVIALLPGFSDRLSFSPFLRMLGCIVLWIEIGPLEPTFRKNWGFPKVLYRLTQWSAHQFVTTSRFTLQSMISVGKIALQDITLVYPGISPVSPSQLKKYQAAGKLLRQQHQLQKKRIVAFTGRLASENQVELVIQAMAKILNQCTSQKKPQLLIIGDGPEKEQYQQLVQKLGISNQVTFTGFISETEKFAWLATCDVFVFTRAWSLDGFGMTTIEAMSVKLPVITPAFGPQLEIVTNNLNGVQFQPNNFHDLAQKISQLLHQTALRHKLALNGYNHVQQTFNQQQQLKLMHDTVERYS